MLPDSMFERIDPPKTLYERFRECMTWGELLCGGLLVAVGFVLGIVFILGLAFIEW